MAISIMAYFEREAPQFNYENITIYEVINDTTNELSSYRARPNEGYVMYDPNDDIYDEEGNLIERKYFTLVGIPKFFNFNLFSYIAVPRDTVPEDQIFGGGNNNHETAK